MLVYNSIIIQPARHRQRRRTKGAGGLPIRNEGRWMHWSTHIKFFLQKATHIKFFIQKGWNLGKELGNIALGYCSVLILLDL